MFIKNFGALVAQKSSWIDKGFYRDIQFGQIFQGSTMEQETIAKIIDTLKSEGIDLVVTLPEEPTSPLTEAIRRDPYFTRCHRG